MHMLISLAGLISMCKIEMKFCFIKNKASYKSATIRFPFSVLAFCPTFTKLFGYCNDDLIKQKNEIQNVQTL